jgi:dinuclear metal center YbgI/SA1388 family protein
MKISEVISHLEALAPLAYQENYDNAGLLIGSPDTVCSGIVCTLDATEQVILEAKEKGCNMVVAHHPILFKGITKITGKNYVEKALICAIKNDIAIYAIHTNLDNVLNGVNQPIALKLGLLNTKILLPQPNHLIKLVTFVPLTQASAVREALFASGAGNIGHYSKTSFTVEGLGSFMGSGLSNPYLGEKNVFHEEKETRIEVILPTFLKNKVLSALLNAHPYEEVAYDFIPLLNNNATIGSGLIGELPESMSETAFLTLLKDQFGLKIVKHTALLNKKVKKIALCGGAGSFLIGHAKAAGADFFVSADIKYHEFFDAELSLVIADIGHWESEQYTSDLLFSYLTTKFPNFAVLKSAINTNPVSYFLG